MAPLIVLIAAFLLASLAIRTMGKQKDPALAARMALSVMLLFTSIGHFIYTDGMALMMPDFIPYKTELVYITGLLEIFAAIGLHIRKVRVLTAWLLILFFILVLSANINAAINHVDYQKADYGGKGTEYLWFRVPLQLLFIGWTYLSSIRPVHFFKEQSFPARPKML